MSLEGNLTSFGLSEILQLIAVQQKTGMLSVTRESGSVKIFFREGRIISTRDRRKGSPDPLKEYLVRYGIVSKPEMTRLASLSAQSKLDVADVLLSEGLLDEAELERHCRNLIQETIYDILTWEQCSYKFIAGAQIIEGVRAIADLSVEGLLMESMRWIDEFPLLREQLPHGGVVVRRKPGKEPPNDLTETEAALLRLLANERTIDDLVANAKVPRFETYETVRQLKERDLVETEDRTPPEAKEAASAVSQEASARHKKNPLPLVAAALVFAACAFWGARSVFPLEERNHEGERAQVSVASTDRKKTEEALRWCLEIYRAKYGSYPKDLTALQAARLAPPSLFERVDRLSFRYHLTPGGRGYILL